MSAEKLLQATGYAGAMAEPSREASLFSTLKHSLSSSVFEFRVTDTFWQLPFQSYPAIGSAWPGACALCPGKDIPVLR